MRALRIPALFIAFCVALAAAAQGVQQGQIVTINEKDGAVTIKLKDGTTKQYRLRDGLVLNAIQVGDGIRFMTEQENGQAVLTKLEKE